MAQRTDEFNKKDIYTATNPENIVSSKKNALFFRRGKEFFVNYEGNLDGKWQKLPYKTVILPPPPQSKPIIYKNEYELWVKTTDGHFDEFNALLPKTGWKFLSNKNIFLGANLRKLNWIFPVPTSSSDIIGNNNSRSYDEDFFYAKISGRWYRTPITVFSEPEKVGVDKPQFSTNLPFVDAPRRLPLPANSNDTVNVQIGEQSYDEDFFYIRVSKWKRARLGIFYNSDKMTAF
jgi:hypothetical protein